MPETNEEVVTAPEASEGDAEGTVAVEEKSERLTELEAELSKRDETIGSLKREVKDLKKPKDEPKTEKTPKAEPEDNDLLQKTYLRAADITAEDEVELALKLSEKTGLSLDKLVDDDYFKHELVKLRDAKATADATSNVKGDAGKAGAKDTPEYWIAKGAPPSREEVPDRKTRAKIAKAFLAHGKTGKTFYNE